jgi:TonB-dependent receptor
MAKTQQTTHDNSRVIFIPNGTIVNTVHNFSKHLISNSMKINIRKRLQLILSMLFLSIFISTVSMAQGKGTISGVITEAESGTSLPGATVIIQGTSIGTITDPYGKYTLTGVPAGTVKMQFSYVGYNDELTDIEVTAGAVIEKNQMLILDMVSLGEIVISGLLLGQTKAINEQLNADGNVSIVSEEKMKQLPDANAAEAIGRISGISLQRNQGEGSKVVMRGLEPKFSNITVNGVKLPSNDPDDRSVDLSMISPEMLQGIEVFKSPTPDMDGDAVGGTVNLRINKASNDPKIKLKTGSGYSQLRNNFKDYYFSGLYSRRFMDSKLGLVVQANTERVNRSSDDIATTYNQTEYYIPDTANYTTAVNGDIRKTEEIRKRNGVSTNIDYQLNNGSISLYGFYNQTTRDIDQRRNHVKDASELKHFVSRRHLKNDVTSLMLNCDYNLGIVKADGNLSYAKTNNSSPKMYEGEWRILSNTNAENFNEHDIRTWFNEGNFAQDNVETRQFEVNSRNISESNVTAALNFELPLNVGEEWSMSLKLGGKFNVLNRVRDNTGDYNFWYYQGVEHGNDFPGAVTGTGESYDIYNQTFFNDNYTGESVNGFDFYNPYNVDKVADFIDTYNKPENGYIENFEEQADNLDATENLAAGYFMAKIKYQNLITIIPGVRIENSDNLYNSFITEKFSDYAINQKTTPVTNSQNYTEILPHFHLKVEPVEWYKFRFSVAKTLARPDYNYVAKSTFVNRADGNENVRQGNTELKHMTAMNYDLSMSFHSFKYGLLTIGGFYKDIENIFYPRDGLKLRTDSLASAYGYPDYKGIRLDSYANSPEAVVYGLEVDLQTSLKFLPKPLNGVVLGSNLTRVLGDR